MPLRTMDRRKAVTITCLAITGLVMLPGLADWESRRRDDALAADLAAIQSVTQAPTPPLRWTLLLGGHAYTCSAMPGRALTYRCDPGGTP